MLDLWILAFLVSIFLSMLSITHVVIRIFENPIDSCFELLNYVRSLDLLIFCERLLFLKHCVDWFSTLNLLDYVKSESSLCEPLKIFVKLWILQNLHYLWLKWWVNLFFFPSFGTLQVIFGWSLRLDSFENNLNFRISVNLYWTHWIYWTLCFLCDLMKYVDHKILIHTLNYWFYVKY